MNTARRRFLAVAGLSPLAIFITARAGAQTPPATCFDPAALPLSQKSRRRAIGYADPSAIAGRNCGGCAFFTAAAPTGCGTCQLLSGGPVSARAVCNSFAPRPTVRPASTPAAKPDTRPPGSTTK